jgi:hypothetical protein
MTQRTDTAEKRDDPPVPRPWHAPEFHIIDVGSTQSGTGAGTPDSTAHVS